MYANTKRRIYEKGTDYTDSDRNLLASSIQRYSSKSPRNSLQRSAPKQTYVHRAPVSNIWDSNSRNTNNHSAKTTCLSIQRRASQENGENVPQAFIRRAEGRSFAIPYEMGAYAKHEQSVSLNRRGRNRNDVFKQSVIECKLDQFSNVKRQCASTLQGVCCADECNIAPTTSIGHRKLSFCELCQADYNVINLMQATGNSCQHLNRSFGVDRAASPAMQNQVISGKSICLYHHISFVFWHFFI